MGGAVVAQRPGSLSRISCSVADAWVLWSAVRPEDHELVTKLVSAYGVLNTSLSTGDYGTFLALCAEDMTHTLNGRRTSSSPNEFVTNVVPVITQGEKGLRAQHILSVCAASHLVAYTYENVLADGSTSRAGATIMFNDAGLIQHIAALNQVI